MSHKVTKSREFPRVPERCDSRRKINALYREIPLNDNTFRTLRKYFNAMANLYGVIPVEKAYEIISEQNPSLVTRDEFAAFAEIARRENEGYYILGRDELFAGARACTIWEREIIDVVIIDKYNGLGFYSDTKDMQKGKPYYIPKKTQLLKYSDPFYMDETPEIAAMRYFFESRMKLPPDIVQSTLEIMVFIIRYVDETSEAIMDCLKKMEIKFKRESDFDRFIALYENLHNATKMQCNMGYSPIEILQLDPQYDARDELNHVDHLLKNLNPDTSADNIANIVSAINAMNDSVGIDILNLDSTPKPAAKRVGRNDPCPCGSGKKYKNCCGLKTAAGK